MGVKEIKNRCVLKKKFELVPPDGGWGYLVALSAIINLTTSTAFVPSFGMIFNEFITETKMSSASVTLLIGIMCICFALSGFFTDALLAFVSKRKLAFVGAVLYDIGIFGTVVMTNPFLFYIFHGIFQSIGVGLLYNLSCTIINEYFVHKKVLIMNFVQTAIGFLTMVAPMFIKWSQDKYGSRGTLLLIGGISLHNLFSVLLLQPVEWHMKKVKVPEKPEQKRLLTDYTEGEPEGQLKKTNTLVVNLTDLNLENCEDAAETNEFPKENDKKSSFRKFFETIIDPSLCKIYLFSCVSFGPSLCNIADGLLSALVPQYLYSMEWSQENVATALALYGFGDLTMRVVFTLTSNWIVKLGVQNIYIIGIAVAAIARLGMLLSSSVTALMVYFTLMGVAHCSIAVLVPVVISEAVPPEKFTSAIGIFILFNGILGLCLGPIIGAVRDFTNSYEVSFYLITSFYILIVILWSMELIIKKNKQKNITKSISESSQLNKVE